jgi:cell volume regulation protein A
MNPVSQFLIIVAALLLLGALGEFIFRKTGVPDVVWLVLAGIIAGPVLQIVPDGLLEPAIPFIGAVSLVVILSGGALKMNIADVAGAAPRALLLAVVGFFFSVLAVVCFFFGATYFGLVKPASLSGWILCGAIVGGASSLIIMPTMAGCSVDKGVARLLEVESSATDTLCIVVTMVMIDLLTSDAVELSRPFVALSREVGLGVGLGVIIGMAFIPLMPRLYGHPHSYTLFLAMMLIVYGVTNSIDGNGAVAVLTCSMMAGNAKLIMKNLVPSAQEFELEEHAGTAMIRGHLTFIIKSFFFTLIGLMFPASPRLIALGAVGALVLLLFRIPAVRLSLRGAGLNRGQLRMVDIAIPRGIAAGVLSTLPVYYGIPNAENLSPGVFSLIVFSILFFAVGFAIVQRSATAST